MSSIKYQKIGKGTDMGNDHLLFQSTENKKWNYLMKQDS